MLVESVLLDAGEEHQVEEKEEVPRRVVVHLEEALPREEGVLQALEHFVPLIDATVGKAPASALCRVPPGGN